MGHGFPLFLRDVNCVQLSLSTYHYDGSHMRSVRSSSVVALRLTASVARKRIRAAIKDTENIKWTDHVMERMERRSLTTGDVLGILASGDVEDAPELQANGRDWKCKVVNKVRGRCRSSNGNLQQ